MLTWVGLRNITVSMCGAFLRRLQWSPLMCSSGGSCLLAFWVLNTGINQHEMDLYRETWFMWSIQQTQCHRPSSWICLGHLEVLKPTSQRQDFGFTASGQVIGFPRLEWFAHGRGTSMFPLLLMSGRNFRITVDRLVAINSPFSSSSGGSIFLSHHYPHGMHSWNRHPCSMNVSPCFGHLPITFSMSAKKLMLVSSWSPSSVVIDKFGIPNMLFHNK